MYEPLPIDTSGVALPPWVAELLEALARHQHEVWAQQRMREGWRPGPVRDDRAREHPCLVPYHELPDSEKEYDRRSASELLKAILAAGYRIEAPAGDTPPSDLAGGEAPAQLFGWWNRRFESTTAWRRAPDVHAALARHLLSQGAAAAALEVVDEGLQSWPGEVTLRQLKGLAHARTGDLEQARAILEGVVAEIGDAGERDPAATEERVGTLARVFKDLGLAASRPRRRRAYLARALALYTQSYRMTGGYWSGINAATLATLLGDPPQARRTAHAVRAQCRQALAGAAPDAPDAYWHLATLGEAALNLSDLAEAERWYRAAYAAGSRRFGDVGVTRRQARLLLGALGHDPHAAGDWLPRPRVVIFSGHMVDRPGRAPARLPPAAADPVKASIKRWLEANQALVGFSSAACGADILFQEALAELGGETYVVLPYPEPAFREDSVDVGGDDAWGRRFETVIARAARVVYASSSRPADLDTAYRFAGHVLRGLALHRAGELETEVLGLAVWDGRPGDGGGGTASAVAEWRAAGLPVHVLPPEPPGAHARLDRPTPRAEASAAGPSGRATGAEVLALLFADVAGFSRLPDPEVQRFTGEFLGRVAALVERDRAHVCVRETWGDGLFLAFRSLRAAGLLALELSELARRTDWRGLGFPRPLELRAALHSGPVHRGRNPITGLPGCAGSHVSRAALLEPKTPAGQVYASETFAALAAVEGIADFTCRYVRLMASTKHHGSLPAYLVRPARPPP